MRNVPLFFRTSHEQELGGAADVLLITITHPLLTSPIRISSDPTVRLSEEPLRYGTESRGNTFDWLPVQWAMPDEGEDVGPSMQLVVANFSVDMIVLLRSTSTPATVLCEVVSTEDLDTVAIRLPVFDLVAADYDEQSIRLTLAIDSLINRQFPAGSFVPSGFPGLFGGGSAEFVPPPPAIVTPPKIVGSPVLGATLTADPGVWAAVPPVTSFAYQWFILAGSPVAIPGATGQSLVVNSHLAVGNRGFVRVTATNPSGSGIADSPLFGPITDPGPPAPLTLPSISGTPKVGSVLTANPGTWSAGSPITSYTYRWVLILSNGIHYEIPGATGPTVLINDPAAAGLYGYVRVTAHNANGSTTADSALVGPIAA